MTQKLTLMRLQKETENLERNPIDNAYVSRVGTFHFHFCLHGLQEPYQGGFYHGVLELHDNYPLRAPKLLFFTPSGRFEVNTPICTSFTNFHQESWTSAWNVRTLILATISFMYSDQPSFGCRNDSPALRRSLARQSRAFNLKNPQFTALFAHKLPQPNPTELQDMQRRSDELMKGEQLEEHLQQEVQGNQRVYLQRERRMRRQVVVLALLIVVLLGLFISLL